MARRLLQQCPGRAGQRGAVVINATLALAVLIIGLLGTELGYMLLTKRDLQKAADLAALAGAQQVQPTSCTAAQQAALSNANGSGTQDANRNLPHEFSLAAGDVECGNWDPTRGDAKDRHFQALPPFNAVRVGIRRTPALMLPVLPGNRSTEITVEAIAALDSPSAAFSVGSKLITSNPDAPLISTLKLAGINVNGLCVGCYSGLANVSLTPSGLLQELGIPVSADMTVGDLNALLAANKVQLGDLLSAIATLASNQGTDGNLLLSANASLLNALGATLDVSQLLIQLGTDAASGTGLRGLFGNISTATAAAALGVQLNALELLTTSVGVATSKNALSLPVSAPTLGISLEARVIEPPSIGIGDVGTMAYNAQVRIVASIKSSASALSGLLGILRTSIDLPIVIDVINAKGELTALDCAAAPPQATITVESAVLNACIGQIPSSVLWSKTDVCTDATLGQMTFVRAMGIDLLYGKVQVPALDRTESLTLSPPPSQDSSQTTQRNALPIGSTVVSLFNQLLALGLSATGDDGSQPAQRASTVEIATSMADDYLRRAGATNVSGVANLLTADGVNWKRPAVLGLLSSDMVSEWTSSTNTCLGSSRATCIRTKLIQSLQTPAQDGLVGGLLGSVLNLVSNLLSLDPKGTGTPLLSTILGPLLQLLSPALDAVGAALSNLLGDVLGIELGRTDVKLHSVSCHTTKLVY
ncbi:TadG family pilus assembly protein [Pseudacidovorax intermedius]|nr:TadG family pilus assembly protein [Pseudacidovorax intermedius]